MKKLAIIGYGAAAIGYLHQRLKYKHKERTLIHVYDSLNQNSAGGLGGLAYDGKLVIGQYAGSDENIPIQIQLEIVNLLTSQIKDSVHYEKDIMEITNPKQMQ